MPRKKKVADAPKPAPIWEPPLAARNRISTRLNARQEKFVQLQRSAYIAVGTVAICALVALIVYLYRR